jgi:3-hydroxybutyryl-CoA dehydratase
MYLTGGENGQRQHGAETVATCGRESATGAGDKAALLRKSYSASIDRRNPVGPFPHERFSRAVVLSQDGVSDFASRVGDTNPLHHDSAFAAATRFGRPIASGTHTTALLLALTASHYAPCGSMVGLEFWVRFRKPIFADEQILLEWLVIRVTQAENATLGLSSCADVSATRTAKPRSARKGPYWLQSPCDGLYSHFGPLWVGKQQRSLPQRAEPAE